MEVNYGQRYRISPWRSNLFNHSNYSFSNGEKNFPAGILAIGLLIYGAYIVAIAKN